MDDPHNIEQKNNQNTDAPRGVVPNTQSTGPLIGTIIVILLLVAGAVYIFITQRVVSPGMGAEDLLSEDAQLLELTQQSDSDALSDIESDISETDFSGLDAELTDIEQELDEALGQ